MKVFITNLKCLAACRIELKSLLSEAELRKMQDLQEKLDEVELFEGIKSKPKDDLSPEEILSMHLYSSACELNEMLEVLLCSTELTERLNSLEEEFSKLSRSQTLTKEEKLQLKRTIWSVGTKESFK